MMFPNRLKGRPLAAALVVAALLLLAGILVLLRPVQASRQPSRWFGSTKVPKDNILRWNNGAEPELVDPGVSVGSPDGNVCRMLWEGLTVNHPETLEPLPGMAERWEMSGDGLVYTFHLRKAVWSDGRPVTAGDFVYSWRRVLSPSTASRYAGLMYYLKNGEAFNKGTITDSTQVGVVAADDSTLIVTLESPTAYWIRLTSFYTYMPVPQWCVEQYGDRWSRPGNVVNNGPFLLTDWKPNDRFVYAKNPTYWDAANVKLDGAVMYSIDDLNTSLNLYKAGVTDWNPSGYLPAQFIPYVRDKADFRTAPYLGVYFYSVSMKNPVLRDKWVRKALAYSIDRESITRDLFKGARIPWGNYTAQGHAGYTPPPGLTFDPEYARECLAKAGYPGGKGFPKISILFNTSEDHRKIAEVAQALWRQHLGIEVELSNQEWGSYLKAATSLDYDVARRSWIGDYPDPNTFLATMVTGDGNNRTGWSNAEYDRLIKEAGREADAGRRFELLRQAETLLLDECPVIPIYNYMLTELIKPYVRGVHPTQTDTHPMKFAWIDHEWRDDAGADGAGRVPAGAPE